MADLVARPSACRWALPILVLLLVLGHACELPAYGDLVGAAHADESHHSGDRHHAGEQEISCDAVSATSSPGSPQLAAALDLSIVPQVNDRVSPRTAARSLEGLARLVARPPLFLLHASFLI
jgi:hypothetical protein